MIGGDAWNGRHTEEGASRFVFRSSPVASVAQPLELQLDMRRHTQVLEPRAAFTHHRIVGGGLLHQLA